MRSSEGALPGPGLLPRSSPCCWVSRCFELVQDSHQRAVAWFELEEEDFVNLHLIQGVVFCLPSTLATASQLPGTPELRD